MHLCILAALEQAPAAVVGKGQVCGQVTQDPGGDARSFPALTAQVLHSHGDLLAVMLQLLSAGCQGLQVGLQAVLGWAKTVSMRLVQLGRWLSWCLLVLAVLCEIPIIRQRSLNPSRCSKWRGDIFM